MKHTSYLILFFSSILLIVLVVLASNFQLHLSISNKNVADTNRWAKVLPTLRRDAAAYSNNMISADEIPERYYTDMQKINCQNIYDSIDRYNCRELKERVIDAYEDPDEKDNRYPKYSHSSLLGYYLNDFHDKLDIK